MITRTFLIHHNKRNADISFVVEDGKNPKSDFEVKRNTNDSRVSKRIKNYLNTYKQIIVEVMV